MNKTELENFKKEQREQGTIVEQHLRNIISDLLIVIDGALYCGHTLNDNGEKIVQHAREEVV